MFVEYRQHHDVVSQAFLTHCLMPGVLLVTARRTSNVLQEWTLQRFSPQILTLQTSI